MTAAPGDEQDARDMARLVEGQENALNELMGRHAERLFHYLLRSLKDEDDAADLAQETFARVYQNRTKFDSRQKFTTWLYAIASNLVRDRFRWRSRHPQVSLDAENDQTEASPKELLRASEPSPDQSLEGAEQAAAVSEAIRALPPELQQPLLLAVYQELPQAEIAAILKCSVKAVETRIYRARQQLRRSLAGLVETSL
jgi:RNA polymerase sigma-70 factor (ECF subfamily)